jgi:hypothetical protein
MKKPRKTPDKIRVADIKPRNPIQQAIIKRNPKAGTHKDRKKEEEKRRCRKTIKQEDEQ